MSAVFEALQQKFGAQIQAMSAQRDDEIYLLVGDPDVRALTEYLRNEFEARLVTVFAEDRRSAEGVFFNYYVFERKDDTRYLIVRAPVCVDDPKFPSLSAELPAVNWQEREIQDWFGLKPVGHPNPRRVALHDNWPDVHPLRKDFPLAARAAQEWPGAREPGERQASQRSRRRLVPPGVPEGWPPP